MKTKIARDVIACLPMGGYAAVMLLAVFCYFRIGHWPTYNTPDPKNLPIPILYDMVAVAFSAGAISLVIYPVSELLSYAFGRVQKSLSTFSLRRMFVFVAGLTLWIADL